MSAPVNKQPDKNLRTPEQIAAAIEKELEFIWEAHRAVGLTGYMCLYTEQVQSAWRAKTNGVQIWFAHDEIRKAVTSLREYYRDGALPNSPLLLNPIVHKKIDDTTYEPLGSGVAWATGLRLGIAKMTPDMAQRIQFVGALQSPIDRGDEKNSGLKMLAIAQTVLPVNPDGMSVQGCKELYDLSDIHSDIYASSYMISGVEYLCAHGLFSHADFESMIPDEDRELSAKELVAKYAAPSEHILNSNFCWNAYKRQHSLFMRFGANKQDVERNNFFFELCGGDIELFERTGMQKPSDHGQDSAAKFEFLVNGLIPRGSVCMLVAQQGIGKSTLCHHLATIAARNWSADAPKPLWLGQEVNVELCEGITVYFAGEDSPAVIHARASILDPNYEAQRLQSHRREFVDKEQSFSQYLAGLRKMPQVPLVIIDPAHKYLSGDESEIEAVAEFFEAMDEFAARKNATVLFTHSLVKGAKPEASMDCLEMIRGAQLFSERPQNIISMHRQGAAVQVALIKNNIPANQYSMTEERQFLRHAPTLQLTLAPPSEA